MSETTTPPVESDVEDVKEALRDVVDPELGINVVDLFVDAFAQTGQLKSKGEVRKAIQQGGAYINNVKVESEDHMMTADQFLPAGDHAVALLRRGKKTLAVACLR